MKKIVSFVMAAAMVASLVPATAFAAGEVSATAKVIGALEKGKDFDGKILATDAPELQLKVSSADYQTTGGDTPEMDVTVELNGAEFTAADADAFKALVNAPAAITVATKEFAEDEVTYTLTGKFAKDDVVAIDLASEMTKVSVGKTATVSVDSKMVTADDLVYATIVDKGIKASIKKTVSVAVEEITELNSKGLTIEPTVDDSYAVGTEFTLKLNKGFEFANSTVTGADNWAIDENEATFTAATADEFTLKDIKIEATTAKVGDVATIKVTAKNVGTASVEVAKVVDYKVALTVDEDEDLPVIYSGTAVSNKGLTDDSDHMTLEVTAEESFPGAWSMRQGFNFTLPEGVYVTNVDVMETENFVQNDVEAGADKWEEAFKAAYKKGDYKGFEFAKRIFDDVNVTLDTDPATVTFKLELVADPTFEGDVVLGFEGALVDKQEVTVAKFVKPYTVKAEQNDVIIDYRNTKIETPIVITEAEAGLWDTDSAFTLTVDRGDMIQFEDDATFAANEESDMELKDEKTENGKLAFAVKSESDEAAVVEIKDIELFMQRNVPAGAYDLKVATSMSEAYDDQAIYAAVAGDEEVIDDVADYSDIVKEAFINVVTSGRDQDNLFTTKVVVPVGESYLIAGNEKVELDVPAYITAAGYTMLPVRAVSKALGVNTNNVLWNAEARTVTIMYGQRIITMTVGQKVVYVNGSAIPSSAAPEITGDRTFLPMRDLATALGVSDITWDAATKTATMNGSK
ncbi:copper amine oxidase N-terminal domain-containing protein [Anaerotignum sp. MB30-C6]|uniref:copper amine oxidase N-terminal domain-containing protein n=1 Tax=Anaerotignum sp. MB30-C6 TaxID=3070814 RepID=UPI0027DDC3E0|nr:copper amine oxidase N-terminal domain-containing protein [Anaerotignum sp. MB30-C6]WMI81239.1 copper amine oxidase N-terminal domain-containing protein [Anaerotignum sp. MB30-C6]